MFSSESASPKSTLRFPGNNGPNPRVASLSHRMEITAYVRPWKQPQQETIIACKKKKNRIPKFVLTLLVYVILTFFSCYTKNVVCIQFISILSLILIAKCIDFINNFIYHTLFCATLKMTLICETNRWSMFFLTSSLARYSQGGIKATKTK